MDFQKAWNIALKDTEIIRTRIAALKTNQDTQVPYVLLSSSSINTGDTVVRKGQVLISKPSLILPPHTPQLDGFDFESEEGFSENSLVNFLLVRGVTLPSMRYNNQTYSLDIFEGRLSQAIKHYEKQLQQEENVQGGLLTGSEEYWQFSLLFFICAQIARNAELDIRKLLEDQKGTQDHDA